VESRSTTAKNVTTLQDKLKSEVHPILAKEFGYKNAMQAPTVKKVSLNIGLGEAVVNAKVLEFAVADMTKIAGQKPVITRAKKSIAAFKLREGMPIGVRVTLRRQQMWQFLERLLYIGLPRVRDFRGVPRRSFDGHGNYTMGIREQIIFPEISYDEIDKVRGMNITLHTSAVTDEEALRMLELMGMPFRKN